MGQFIILIFFIASSLTYLKANPVDASVKDTVAQCSKKFDELSGLSKTMCFTDCLFKAKNMTNCDGSVIFDNWPFQDRLNIDVLLERCNSEGAIFRYIQLIHLNPDSFDGFMKCDPEPLAIVKCLENEFLKQWIN